MMTSLDQPIPLSSLYIYARISMSITLPNLTKLLCYFHPQSILHQLSFSLIDLYLRLGFVESTISSQQWLQMMPKICQCLNLFIWFENHIKIGFFQKGALDFGAPTEGLGCLNGMDEKDESFAATMRVEWKSGKENDAT